MRLEYTTEQEKELRIAEIEATLTNCHYSEFEEKQLEIELQHLQGCNAEAITVFTVYTYDHTGEDGVITFASLEAAQNGIREDINIVAATLLEDGHDAMYIDDQSKKHFSLYVPNTDIYYEWTLFETELQN